MTLGETLFLGFVQGLTEFFPVSSSGHLALFQQFFGWTTPSLGFDLLLHVGTLGAVLLFFAREICGLGTEWFRGLWNLQGRSRPGWLYGWALLVGTLGTLGVGMLLKDWVEHAFTSPLLVGGALLTTGVILLFPFFIEKGKRNLSLGGALVVGCIQGMAVFPGISRSGSTIVGGLLLGLEREEAFRFSFLLSVPAIAGAMVLETFHLGGLEALQGQLPPGAWLGMAVAFVSGYVALWGLKRVVLFGKWHWFALYCLLLGSGALLWGWIR